MTYVVAGGPVRNRAWILPDHLLLVQVNRPWAMHYLVGDSTDGTANMLREKTKLVEWRLTYAQEDTDFERDPARRRGESDGAHLGAVRNRWLETALEEWPDASHLWVVDSDVLPERGVLERLLQLKKPVVGAFVPLADGKTPIHMYGWDAKEGRAKRFGTEAKAYVPHPVSLLGGCYLVEREVFEAGVRWGPHPQGEDGYFADRCREHDVELWVDPLARCEHVMERDR